VIVMTDFRAPDVEAEALAAGAAGCLTKPFAAEALVRALLAAAGDGARAARERGSTGG
jgi:CheY-like chemotaxis protein